MGGGEGDEDLGDDDVAAESAQPGQIEVDRQRPRLTRPPRSEAEEAGGTS